MARKDLPLIRFYDQDFVDVYEQSWNRIDSAVIKGTAENGFAKEFFVYEPSGVINQTEAIFSTFFLVYSNGSYNSSSCLDNFYAKQEADGAIRGVYSLEDGRPILTEENPEGVLPPLFSYAELNIYHKDSLPLLRLAGREIPRSERTVRRHSFGRRTELPSARRRFLSG